VRDDCGWSTTRTVNVPQTKRVSHGRQVTSPARVEKVWQVAEGEAGGEEGEAGGQAGRLVTPHGPSRGRAVLVLGHAEAASAGSSTSSLVSGSRQGVSMSDEDLLAMLRVIGRERSDSLDSSAVSRRLGWTDAMTASSLDEAKSRLLVWGIRVGGMPGPRFEDIELTVQGRRRITAADVDATSSVSREPLT
jgi:hypothetical protein